MKETLITYNPISERNLGRVAREELKNEGERKIEKKRREELIWNGISRR